MQNESIQFILLKCFHREQTIVLETDTQSASAAEAEEEWGSDPILLKVFLFFISAGVTAHTNTLWVRYTGSCKLSSAQMNHIIFC